MAEGTRLGDCLVDYFRARMAAMTAARLQIGIGELDARAVLYLADHPGTRPTTLREHLGVTSAAVTTLIDRMVARGALRRDPDPDDRRASRVSAIVDLRRPPWDELTRFDRDVVAAASALSPGTTQAALDAVDRVLESVRVPAQS